MWFVADVHGADVALSEVAEQARRTGEPLLVLGDLINFIDYRDLSGIVSDVCGEQFVADMVSLRTAGDMAAAAELWRTFSAGREDSLRDLYVERIDQEYQRVCAALGSTETYVLHGNVDQPLRMTPHLPTTATYVDSDVVEIDGFRIGLVSGGLPSLGTPGEVSHEAMAEKLSALGPVDILCTHIPPAVRELAGDVIGGRKKGSPAVLDYLITYRPRFHYFGDIHQPQATQWAVGSTLCRNVGYFRATKRAVRHG